MTREVLIKGLECKCNECLHVWTVAGEEKPLACPSCKSDEWNGVYHSDQLKDNSFDLTRADQERLNREAVRAGFYKAAERPVKKYTVKVNNDNKRH